MPRYADRARLVFHFAREEGSRLGHAMIGPEHLLLGILREGGETTNTLASFGVTLGEARARVEQLVGRGNGLSPNEAIAITPRARRVMELAEYEALNLGATTVNVGHILLGILNEGDGVAYRVIQHHRDVDIVRWHLLESLGVADALTSNEGPTEVAGPTRYIRAIKTHKTVYLGIKYHADLSNRSLLERISSTLQEVDCQTLCVVRDGENWGAIQLGPAELMELSFSMIDTSDVVLLELSEKGVGLGIEAGYAYAKGKPIITIAKQGSDISATLQGISKQVSFYNNPEELTRLLVKLIADG
jgi:Clp amino terminal domain, pathogenicity island component